MFHSRLLPAPPPRLREGVIVVRAGGPGQSPGAPQGVAAVADAFNSRSIAATSALSSGTVRLAKLPTTRPSREIRYLWKFHSGVSPVALIRSRYSGVTSSPLTWTF